MEFRYFGTGIFFNDYAVSDLAVRNSRPTKQAYIILNCTDQETTTLDNFVVLGKSIESIWSVSCDGTISILLDTIIETCEVRARYLVTLKEDHQPGTPR